ncbi:transketolase [Sporichthya brevicatena]|uniref:transketolase n=1 Tax=Sporichthya brevicatena TaxID=171442 RepID=UPI0031DA42D6
MDASADVDALAVDTIRFLAADMVEQANSGHPGMPMGAAAMAWTLFSRHLKHDPADPDWPDRDRFVLSAGHGSALQYALLHLFGYDLPMHELRAFRRIGSRTPGHPEHGHTPGVETTTGPLGQGLANAVGMALAERMLAAEFPEVVEHHTYAIVGDGCLMEGISHEAASLAGHLGLGRLTVLWDDNRITIDGGVDLACSDDVLARFEAYGWHVLPVADGTDVDAIDAALTAAKADPRPSFLAVRTVIGRGAPGIEGTPKAHGSPLGETALSAAKARAGWHHPAFAVPEPVRDRCLSLAAVGTARRREWEHRLTQLSLADPARGREWDRRLAGALPSDWHQFLTDTRAAMCAGPRDARATRIWSRQVLEAMQHKLPELVGGSADLAGSTGVDTGFPVVRRDDWAGRAIPFGVREFAMAAVLNGLSLHGGFRVFGSTFAVFSDYLRPALRLSALMRQPVIYVLTHDSVAVGEDGPTHQPVEHLESLRLIPGVRVFRPANGLETLTAWTLALEHRSGPSVIALSRQALPALSACAPTEDRRLRVVHVEEALKQDASRAPDVEFLATGSEVGLAVEAAKLLDAQGLHCRVRSVLERDALLETERDARLTVSVEAGVTAGWHRFAGLCLGVDEFGLSGPGPDVLRVLDLTPEAVAAKVLERWVGRARPDAPPVTT